MDAPWKFRKAAVIATEVLRAGFEPVTLESNSTPGSRTSSAGDVCVDDLVGRETSQRHESVADSAVRQVIVFSGDSGSNPGRHFSIISNFNQPFQLFFLQKEIRRRRRNEEPRKTTPTFAASPGSGLPTCPSLSSATLLLFKILGSNPVYTNNSPLFRHHLC